MSGKFAFPFQASYNAGMQYRIVPTADGTISCLDSETGELCHNRAGAYAEALKNYAEPSKAVELAAKNRDVRLLDACFGLGYNSWVLFDHLVKNVHHAFTLSVTAIEQSEEILSFSPRILEHPSFDNLKSQTGLSEHNIDYRTQQCTFDTNNIYGKELKLSSSKGQVLHLEIQVADLRTVVPALVEDFDLVFHDPFSPRKMPELWTVDLFRHYHRLLSARKGRLLTYSTAAAVRGGLAEAGFDLGKTMALGQKQGGTIATVQPEDTETFSALEIQYMASRAGIPYRDPDLATTREMLLEARWQEQEASNRPSGQSVRKLLQK